MDMHEDGKLRQSGSKKELLSGLKNLPQPNNEYQIVIQPFPEDEEEPEEKIEEDMSDRIAREKAEEEARQQALLKKRSKVLQRELPRPPPASLDLIRDSLIRADEDKSSFVPPTLVEQADELIRKELLSLLEHDNVKYPLDEKSTKEKKKGGKRAANGKSVSVPPIDEFEENELKEADELIKDEAELLRVAMGHENESLDGYVEAHKTCLNDMMYFPTRDGYGLSSVANNMEKLAALQNEFENVKKKMDDETKKAQRLEQKIKVLTNGYQMRAGKLWTQIEATFKQMDTAGTELECFQALQKQEQLSATHRISNLWEEVQKQKELERILQKRYGDLLPELERLQHLIDAYRLQAETEREQELAAKNDSLAVDKTDVAMDQTAAPDLETPKGETAANNDDLELSDAAAEPQGESAAESQAESAAESQAESAAKPEPEPALDQSVAPDLGNPESTAIDDGNSMEVDNPDDKRSQELDAAQINPQLISEHGTDDGAEKDTTSATSETLESGTAWEA
ncbi:Cell division cycle 5-like protein [Sesamum angolense]|uniref:Cell division cycle 5-like protein n=1 Tax=Sesamum angolense TaxID=2727404 RepID=A0AAE2BZX6_9LAMI|nr:Cell division cycle 5-like protein [Sesamum angolense]